METTATLMPITWATLQSSELYSQQSFFWVMTHAENCFSAPLPPTLTNKRVTGK